MEKVKGNALHIFVGTSYVAYTTSHNLSMDAETSDSSTKDDGVWGNSEVTKINWSCGIDAKINSVGDNSYDMLFAAMKAKQPVTIKYGTPANYSEDGMPTTGWTAPTKGYTGKALITSLNRTDPKGEDSTMTCTLTGVGELAEF